MWNSAMFRSRTISSFQRLKSHLRRTSVFHYSPQNKPNTSFILIVSKSVSSLPDLEIEQYTIEKASSEWIKCAFAVTFGDQIHSSDHVRSEEREEARRRRESHTLPRNGTFADFSFGNLRCTTIPRDEREP